MGLPLQHFRNMIGGWFQDVTDKPGQKVTMVFHRIRLALPLATSVPLGAADVVTAPKGSVPEPAVR